MNTILEEVELIKAINLRRRPKVIFFCLLALFFGVLFDLFIFPQQATTTVYIPLMIMLGIISEFHLTNIIISGGLVLFIQFFSPEKEMLEIFFLRWGCFFLIAFAVNTLINNSVKEKENIINLITTVSKSIDARDKYTSFHSQNVAYYSLEIGKAMNLSNRVCNDLYLGGLLHDVGKIGIPEAILNKPTRLTLEEYEHIKQHPQIGYDMLKHISLFKKNSILDMVLHHHEKYDGTGYPHGLKGENIPLEARIMAVADAFDAMTSNRVYREMNHLDYALNQISNGKESQFDPEIAQVFLELIESRKIKVRGFEKDT